MVCIFVYIWYVYICIFMVGICEICLNRNIFYFKKIFIQILWIFSCKKGMFL